MTSVLALAALASLSAGPELNKPEGLDPTLQPIAEKVMEAWNETPTKLSASLDGHELARKQSDPASLTKPGRRCFQLLILMARARLANLLASTGSRGIKKLAAQHAFEMGRSFEQEHCDDKDGPGPGSEGKRAYLAAVERMKFWAMHRAIDMPNGWQRGLQAAGQGGSIQAVKITAGAAIALAGLLFLPAWTFELPTLPAALSAAFIIGAQ